MLETVLFVTHSILLLFFGTLLSGAFAGLRPQRLKDWLMMFYLVGGSGVVQLIVLLLFGEDVVVKIYPIIVHLPTVLIIYFYYHKKLATALAATGTAYLCCHPADWFGSLVGAITENAIAEICVRIVTLVVTLLVVAFKFAPSVSNLFNKRCRHIYIFGVVPITYYVLDYVMGVYTGVWENYSRLAGEFYPLLLCGVHLVFSFVYYKEYEQKSEAEQKEKILEIAAQQQTKEMEHMKRSEQEVRQLRHDMRFLLSNVAMCIENDDLAHAKEMLANYNAHIEGTRNVRCCHNDMVNYIISDVAAKCQQNQVEFSYSVEVNTFPEDEVAFASILSNALDNALNAQQTIEPEKRGIRLMLKTVEGKVLLSVRNPVAKEPKFSGGLPVTDKKGHVYGTQSIRYLAERMGGNCQFSYREGMFVLRVIL